MNLRSHLVPLLAAALLLVPSISAHAVETTYLFDFGSFGTGDGQFSSPSRIALGPSGDVYVLDYGNQRIEKFGPDGNFITRWNHARPTQGNMEGIAVGPDGSVYVQATSWITKYDADGVYQMNWSTGVSSSYQWDLTMDPAGNVCYSYVHLSTCTKRFTSFGSQVGVPFCYGANASGMLFNANGEYFITTDNDGSTPRRIYRFTAAGAPIANWPSEAYELGIDASGNLYAPQSIGNVVRVFDNSGGDLASFGSAGSGPGQFNTPSDVDVAPDGRIYVVDQGNHRIQVFGPGPVEARAATWGRIKAGYR